MAGQLKPSAPGASGARRIIKSEAEKALAELRKISPDPAGDAAREAVHEVRKRLKRVRALLRLIRSAFGKRAYHVENTAYRDVARPLTRVRDAGVLIATLDKVCHSDELPNSDACSTIRQTLIAREQEIIRCELLEQHAAETAASALRDALDRVDQWALAGHGWTVLGPGVKRVYRSGRKAGATAQRAPTVENLHEWRKQAKYLRHQLEALRPVWPGVLDDLADKAHELGNLLGDDHDLAVLRDELEDAQRYPVREALAALEQVMAKRRFALQRRAREIGRDLYALRPGAFTDRLEECWRLWRRKPRATAHA